MRTTQIFNDEDQFSIIANYKMISFGNITVENFSFLKPRRQNECGLYYLKSKKWHIADNWNQVFK